LSALPVCEEVDVHPVLRLHAPRRLEPDVVAEMVRPVVELLPEPVRLEDGGGDAPVAHREKGFDAGAFRLRVAEADRAGRAAEGLSKQRLLAPRLLQADVRLPLEG